MSTIYLFFIDIRQLLMCTKEISSSLKMGLLASRAPASRWNRIHVIVVSKTGGRHHALMMGSIGLLCPPNLYFILVGLVTFNEFENPPNAKFHDCLK
jgi:hypothetical protein